MAQIVCKDVSLGYDGTAVCEHVNFSIEKGDYLCIVGDNGSGKSTLMRALLRLKSVDGGEISLGDGVVQSDIGYLPQHSDAQKDFPASVWEIVMSGCVGRRGFRFFMNRANKAIAERNMRCMRITDLKNKPFGALSGGQQQRVMLARALCATDKVLLLDEPTSALDPTASRDMYSAIRHLNEDHGTTIIMITHDLDAVARYATKVLRMSDEPTFYESRESFCRERGIAISEEGER